MNPRIPALAVEYEDWPSLPRAETLAVKTARRRRYGSFALRQAWSAAWASSIGAVRWSAMVRFQSPRSTRESAASRVTPALATKASSSP